VKLGTALPAGPQQPRTAVALPKSAPDISDRVFMFNQHLAKNAVKVRVPGHFAFNSVALCINEIVDKRFDILQVPNPVNPENDEVIPFPRVPISQVPLDSSK
jgi:hypothetical protein